RPRSETLVVQAVSEKSAPPRGAVGTGIRPGPPQKLVPGTFVVLRWAKPASVVVVVLAVVVVVSAPVVVVSAPVVVVSAPVVVVAPPVVVVVGGEVVVAPQGFGSHVPGPKFAPPALEHSVAVSRTQAPPGEPGRQHWIGPSVVVVVVDAPV